MTTVAEAFIATLNQVGVQRIYGIVGDSLNGITKVLREQNKIKWVHTRHEEVAAFAAGAEAQLTGQLAVCAGSCGPGNLHLINGLYDCHRSQAPVLAIAAQIPSEEIGGGYFQETNPTSLFKECSHFCEVVHSPEQLPRLLNIAIQTALTKRGVAVLVISGDVTFESIPTHIPLSYWTPVIPPRVVPCDVALDEAAKLLNDGKKITLFCGIGAATAHDELIKIAETLQAPIAHTLRGKPFIEYDNPYDIGMTGLIGIASGYYAMESCDTLVLIGTSFPYRQFYPTHARVIQIDIDGQQIGKRTCVDVGLIGDTQATLQALLPRLKAKKETEHLQQARKHYQKACQSLNKYAHQKADEKAIHPQYLTYLISQHATENALFTCDVGTPTAWAARYLKMNGQRRLLGSFNHGSMANALPQAIGAQMSHPKQQIIALCGDGGLGMCLGDLLTLIQHQLPIKIVVFNNRMLDFVKLEMNATGMQSFGTDLCATHFNEIAKAMGIFAVRVEKTEALEEGVKTVLNHQGPALLDVCTNPDELIMPPTLTMKEMKGFGIYMLKAILDGEGKQILNLAKDNLWAL